MNIRDAMTSPVVSIRPDTPFKAIVEEMVRADVSGLPVIDDAGHLVGIVTEADLASKEAYVGHRHRALSLFADVFAAPNWVKKAFGWTAAEVMTSGVVVCAPDEELQVATQRMLEHRVKRLPVVDAGTVVGMLSRQDILRTLVRPDAEILAEVEQLLASDRNRPDDAHVQATVHNGVVTLAGDVRLEWDEPAVIELVRRVRGVIDVANHLHHREPNPQSTRARLGLP